MNRKVSNIQGLRAYAALAVVVFHTGYIFPHLQQMGKFGVDIFFVISGYIMARICEGSTRYFLRRRIIRIVPPYWVATLLLFLFAQLYPQLLIATHPTSEDLVKSLLFIPFYKVGLIRPVLYVGWSLNYEMLFYLVVALGLAISTRHPLRWASAILGSLFLISIPLSKHGALFESYSSPVMLEFLLGVAAYELARRVSVEMAKRIRVFSLASLIFALALIVYMQGGHPPSFVGDWMILQLAAMLSVLSASLLSQGGWDLDWGWLVLIGDASYMLYLIHPYILVFCSRVLRLWAPWLRIDHAMGAIASITVCVLVSLVIHLKLELPAVRYLNSHFGGHRRSTEFSARSASPRQVAP